MRSHSAAEPHFVRPAVCACLYPDVTLARTPSLPRVTREYGHIMATGDLSAAPLLTWLVVLVAVHAQRDRPRIAAIGGSSFQFPLAVSTSAAAVPAHHPRQSGQAEGLFVGAELRALGVRCA